MQRLLYFALFLFLFSCCNCKTGKNGSIVEGRGALAKNGIGFHSPQTVHLMVGAERRAFADRYFYLADPELVSIPLKEMPGNKNPEGKMSSCYVKATLGDGCRITWWFNYNLHRQG